MWFNKLMCLWSVCVCRHRNSIKDQPSERAIIIRAIKGQDTFEYRNKKPEKPQSDFYDPFVMRFVWMEPIQRAAFPSILCSMSNNMISDFLKPTTEPTVKFRILFKLFLELNVRLSKCGSCIVVSCFYDLISPNHHWVFLCSIFFTFFRRKFQLKLNKKWIEMVVRMSFFSPTRRLKNKTKLRADAWFEISNTFLKFFVCFVGFVCVYVSGQQENNIFANISCRFEFLSFRSIASCIWARSRTVFMDFRRIHWIPEHCESLASMISNRNHRNFVDCAWKRKCFLIIGNKTFWTNESSSLSLHSLPRQSHMHNNSTETLCLLLSLITKEIFVSGNCDSKNIENGLRR